MSRRDEVSRNLAAVEERIVGACAAAGRSRDEVTLIVVAKTYPASDVAILSELGVADIGENRHPEARDKKAALGTTVLGKTAPGTTAPGTTAPGKTALGAGVDALTWHFVGGLQSNKAAAVAEYADVVHSVDRTKVVHALSKGAVRAERVVDCLVQVNLEGPAADPRGRAGADATRVGELAAEVDAAEGLRLRGVMAVAPLGADPRPAFEALREIGGAVVRDFPSASMVSAGMSDDLEAAIRAGATHVRIGRSVLGDRPPLG